MDILERCRMKLPYEQLINRELDETLKAKRSKGFDEMWPVIGEMAKRLKRLKELLRCAEDYGIGSPELNEKIDEIVSTFRTYKLNGSGDKYG